MFPARFILFFDSIPRCFKSYPDTTRHGSCDVNPTNYDVIWNAMRMNFRLFPWWLLLFSWEDWADLFPEGWIWIHSSIGKWLYAWRRARCLWQDGCHNICHVVKFWKIQCKPVLEWEWLFWGAQSGNIYDKLALIVAPIGMVSIIVNMIIPRSIYCLPFLAIPIELVVLFLFCFVIKKIWMKSPDGCTQGMVWFGCCWVIVFFPSSSPDPIFFLSCVGLEERVEGIWNLWMNMGWECRPVKFGTRHGHWYCLEYVHSYVGPSII